MTRPRRAAKAKPATPKTKAAKAKAPKAKAKTKAVKLEGTAKPSFDPDDPAEEDRWCAERRADVERYLEREGLKHRGVGEWPAWSVPPYVSIWAIESHRSPGWVGWWAISGDLPTDYVSCGPERHPRAALRDISARWLDVAGFMERGEPHPTVTIGSAADWPTLGPLLRSRAEQLAVWADDDAQWLDL